MKQIMRLHISSCGHIEAFIQTHRLFTLASHEPHTSPWDMSTDFHDHLCSCTSTHPLCLFQTLYQEGWERGQALAHLAIKTTDLSVYEHIGTIGGWTSRRPPRHFRSITAERDAHEANLHGEVLTSFIRAWKHACPAEHKRGI